MPPMRNIEQSRADFTRLLDAMESCDKTMGSAANMGRALAIAVSVHRKIGNVRIINRGNIQRVVHNILGEEEDELRRLQGAQKTTMSRIIREIGELGRTFGLLIIARLRMLEVQAISQIHSSE